MGELYHKVGQALLQTRAALRYDKVDQKLLQSGTVAIVKCGINYKVGRLCYK